MSGARVAGEPSVGIGELCEEAGSSWIPHSAKLARSSPGTGSSEPSASTMPMASVTAPAPDLSQVIVEF
jgi:hypothetical protein